MSNRLTQVVRAILADPTVSLRTLAAGAELSPNTLSKVRRGSMNASHATAARLVTELRRHGEALIAAADRIQAELDARDEPRDAASPRGATSSRDGRAGAARMAPRNPRSGSR